VKDISD